MEKVHREEVAAERHVHDDQMHNMDLALASRDVFGQAKGIIMVTMHCGADEAFRLIQAQSQAENRKAVEIAREIVSRVSRRASG
jgi:AmiR/NasT family two-component response regulator